MHTPALPSLLLALATATLVRAQACPAPDAADGWFIQYGIPEGSSETVCYWLQCAELGGRAGFSPTYYECVPHDKCMKTQAGWCRDRGGGVYEGTKGNMFGKKRAVALGLKGVGREWVA